MTDQACGRIGMHTVSRCAEKAANEICGLTTQHAVCLAPTGHVSVESVDKALVSDIVGVYLPDAGPFNLWLWIEGDLRAAMIERGIIGGRNHMRRVMGKRAA